MTLEDPSPFFWSWPRYTVRKVFRRNLRVDYTCPSPADVNRNTLQSRPAMWSEMPLYQEQSWAGPKIHRHKCSTESTAHLCPLLRKLRVKERGKSQFLWNTLIVWRSLYPCKQVQFQLKAYNIFLLPAPPFLPRSPAKAYSLTWQVFKTILQAWGGIRKPAWLVS